MFFFWLPGSAHKDEPETQSDSAQGPGPSLGSRVFQGEEPPGNSGRTLAGLGWAALRSLGLQTCLPCVRGAPATHEVS